MLVRDMKRAALFLLPSVVSLYLLLAFFRGSLTPTLTKPANKDGARPPPLPFHSIPAPPTHNELLSLTTPSGSYFTISFGPGQEGAINPNIIPHPTEDDLYAIVAQEVARGTPTFHEIACYASYNSTSSLLSCIEPARPLPIAPTKGQKCPGKYKLLDFNVGPHDARVFWGVDGGAYVVYGSNSQYGCFGQFIQNFPVLMDWTEEMMVDAKGKKEMFRVGTEMQRPGGPRGTIEKNWFVFWDRAGQIYAQYDIQPRSFARIAEDGSVVGGEDLAPAAQGKDGVCLERYMPTLADEDESIHQATNSLAVTLCRRADPGCIAEEGNTVVFTIFHKKTFRDYHATYEPYVVAFRQTAPFEVYAVGRKPLWVKGRGARSDGETEMVFVTSIGWKGRGQRYHGYLDDAMFLGFGIEDIGTGGIDVLAGDVLRDLGLCEGL
ncbi:hypothetical protein GE09DRAFT_460133 [Coniochaeta sp. 2T2.1]|nr:hypothetical protein GE09DRAFT_460133 [Coniochaeta sp. 2T2.1]